MFDKINLLLLIMTTQVTIVSNYPLSKLTFYGIGGLAHEVYKIFDIECFSEIWAETINQRIPKIVIGKGSNFVFSDKGFYGRVFVPSFQGILWQKNLVTVESGMLLQTFIEQTNKEGFGDLCNLSGIPGTIGGAIYGNAGAYNTEISDYLESIQYLDEYGQIKEISKKQCKFAYRHSIFKEQSNWCITKVRFLLHKKELIIESYEKTKQRKFDRWKKYPAGRSGGCVFKNPSSLSIQNNKKLDSFNHEVTAGQLLDKLCAKNDRFGDIIISKEHSNFFVNLGKGTQKDLLFLIHKWQSIVHEKYNILLEKEIFICDEYGISI